MKEKKKYLIIEDEYIEIGYLILVIITGLVIFSPCIWGNQTLVYDDWGYDTYNQYLPVYDFFKNIFQQQNFSEYYFTYGLGTSLFVFLSWISDIFTFPLILISIVLKQEIGNLIVYAQFAKIVVGGMVTFKYLRLRNYSEYGTFVGAYIFAFCGYFFVAGQHYFFATYLVYYVMLLYAVEKAFNKKKYIFLVTLVSCLIALHSAYASFQIFLAAGIYVCYRAYEENEKIAKALNIIVYYAIHMILGLLMGMVFFLPILFEILNASNRVETTSLGEKILKSFSMADYSVIKTALLRLLGNNVQGSVNSWTGVGFHFDTFPYTFSSLFLVFLILYIKKTFTGKMEKKKRGLRMINIIVIFMIIFNNFIPSLFNLFQYPMYRFVFVLMPLFASIVAEGVDDLLLCKCIKNDLPILILSALGIISLLKKWVDFKTSDQVELEIVLIILTLLFGVVCLCFFCSKNRYVLKGAKIVFVLILGCNLIIDDSVSLYYGRKIMTKTELQTSYYNNSLATLYDTVKKRENNNFYRVDRTFEDAVPDSLYSLKVFAPTLSVYNSIIGDELTDFSNSFVLKMNEKDSWMYTLQYAAGNFGETFNNIMGDVVGLKYIITDTRRYDEGWEFISENNGYYLYKNNRINSSGLLYSNIITKNSFEQLTELEKAFVLNSHVVVEESKKNKNNEKISIPYEKKDEAIQYDNITLNGCGSDTEKTIINVENERTFIGIPLNSQVINVSGQTNILSVKLETNTECTLSVSYSIGEAEISNSSSLHLEKRKLLKGINEIYLNVPNDAKMINICFEDIADNENKISLLQENMYCSRKVYDNDNISFKDIDYGQNIEGEVECDDEKYLLLPILFDKRWTAYVDGNKTEIQKADCSFSMLNISEGKHKIQLVYHNEYFRLGIYISSIAFLVYLFEIWLYKKKNKMSKK